MTNGSVCHSWDTGQAEMGVSKYDASVGNGAPGNTDATRKPMAHGFSLIQTDRH